MTEMKSFGSDFPSSVGFLTPPRGLLPVQVFLK
jgi:hypothetical protein